MPDPGRTAAMATIAAGTLVTVTLLVSACVARPEPADGGAGHGADQRQHVPTPNEVIVTPVPPPRVAPGVTTTTLAPVRETNVIRVAHDGAWVDTTCSVFPSDSYWHTDVRGLPTMEPTTPDGSGLEGFPVVSHGFSAFEDSLQLGVGLLNTNNTSVNWTDSTDPLRWVTTDGVSRNAEHTAVDFIDLGPLSLPTNGRLRHRVPEDLLLESSSTDDHALFLDTDRCTLIEYIRWSRIPGAFSGQLATVFDLRTNERRLSVRPDWTGPANNGPAPRAIDSPYSWVDPSLTGMGGLRLDGPRGSITAAAGSGMSRSAGMVRLDEIFATPLPGDQEVDPDRRIDHAIGVALPAWNVTPTPTSVGGDEPVPFLWPATRSDGCAEIPCSGDLDGITGSQYQVPMGSRLRLKADQCNAAWIEPQAARIVQAMCEFGLVVTDTSGQFGFGVERSQSAEGSKWRGEAKNELATLTLRDFELVDVGSIAAVDPHALWESARQWALERYGPGVTIQNGWYDGTYWGLLLRCNRPDLQLGPGTRAPCTDPDLALADNAVNGPDWLRVTQ